MKTDIPTNGSMVKKHISFKTGFGYPATRGTSFQSWFQACQRLLPLVLISQLQGHLQDRRGIVLHLLQARLRHRQQHKVIMRHMISKKDLNSAETHTPVLLMNHPYSPHPREVWIWINTVFILTSLKTEIARSVKGQIITRAPCTRRIGGAVPLAEICGDLITADHKVLRESCES